MATNRAELLVELLAFAERKGWDYTRLAAEMGLNSSAVISNWKRRGEVSSFAVENCAKFGLFLVGEAAFEIDHGSNAEPAKPLAFKPAMAPVVGQVKGGADGYFEEIPMAVGDSDIFVPYWGFDPNAFGLRIVGDSMSPRYNHGEFIVACPNIPYARGKYVYVSLVSGQKLVKRLGMESDDAFELTSVNNAYKPVTVLRMDIERICVVQGPFDPDDIKHR